MNTCPTCGTLDSGKKFCTSCGAKLRDAASTPEPAATSAAPSTRPTRASAPRRAAGTGSAASATGWRAPRGATVVVVALVVVAAAAGAVLASVSGGSVRETSTASVTSEPAPSGAVDATAEESAPAEPAVPEVTSEPAPEEQVERRCWDGTLLRDGSRCARPTGPEALRFALPTIDFRDDCGIVRATSDHYHEGWNYNCVLNGASYHVAEYLDARRRAGRLSDYGPCSSIGRGLCIAGPLPASPRRVKTYADGVGVFYYISSPAGRRALDAVRMRSADELLFGVPVARG